MRKQVAVHVWMRENKVTESEDVDEHEKSTEQAHSADEIGVGGTTAGWSTRRSWGQRSRREGLCVHPCAVPPRERGQIRACPRVRNLRGKTRDAIPLWCESVNSQFHATHIHAMHTRLHRV